MRNIIRAMLVAGALLSATTAAAATIVDIAATDADGTTVQFERGRYAIQFIGIADGGAFDAYGLWYHQFPFTDPRSGSNCQAGTAQCRYGYQSIFRTTIDGAATIFRLASDLTVPIDRHYRYATTAAALAAAKTGPYTRALEFSVAGPTAVNFAVDDTSHWDNEGGVSLLVTEVPEPATWALLVVGFGLVGAAARGRRRSVTLA